MIDPSHPRPFQGLILITLASCGLAGSVRAQGGDEKPEGTTEVQAMHAALQGGKTWLKFRPRYEMVDQDGIADRGYAATLRTVLGYSTGDYRGFSGTLEFEAVSVIGDDGYNNTVNGKASRPVIADAEDEEINQAYLQYTQDKLTVRGGRQRIILGNHRFVGNVGWRQNEQTFDAISAKLADFEGFNGFYAFVRNANRIFGDSSPAGDHRMESHLFQVDRDTGVLGKVTAYLFHLDYDTAQALSTATYGARLAGAHEEEDGFKFHWVAEYAHQNDVGSNPFNIDAGYLNLEAGGARGKWSAAIGFESLEGGGAADPNNVFSTPLATLHKFNGWADKFLATPAGGLEDLYLRVSGDFDATDVSVIYHDFAPENGGSDYGTEIDVVATHKTECATYGVKFAAYDADAFATDTEKFWFWMAFGF